MELLFMNCAAKVHRLQRLPWFEALFLYTNLGPKNEFLGIKKNKVLVFGPCIFIIEEKNKPTKCTN